MQTMQIFTDATGRIREASAAACALLELPSPRTAVNRSLILFFYENRECVVQLNIAAAGGPATHFLGLIQSLTGCRKRVTVTVARTPQDELLRWTLSIPE